MGVSFLEGDLSGSAETLTGHDLQPMTQPKIGIDSLKFLLASFWNNWDTPNECPVSLSLPSLYNIIPTSLASVVTLVYWHEEMHSPDGRHKLKISGTSISRWKCSQADRNSRLTGPKVIKTGIVNSPFAKLGIEALLFSFLEPCIYVFYLLWTQHHTMLTVLGCMLHLGVWNPGILLLQSIISKMATTCSSKRCFFIRIAASGLAGLQCS